MRALLACLALAGLLLAAPPLVADQTDVRLPGLFERLLATQDDSEASAIEQQIWQIWYETADPKIQLMMAQGAQAMSVGDFDAALEIYDRIIVDAPAYAEGWNRRATLNYLMGRFDASIADVQHVLTLEPRHFGALSGMGLIYTAIEDDKSAIAWFGKALEVNPHMYGVRKRMEDLKDKVEGEPT